MISESFSSITAAGTLNARYSVDLPDPGKIKVAEVAALVKSLPGTVKALREANKVATEARERPRRLSEQHRADAARAGKEGTKFSAKAARKAQRDAEDDLEIAELEQQVASARAVSHYEAIVDAVIAHSDPLLRQALADAEAALLGLTTARTMLAQHGAAFGSTTAFAAMVADMPHKRDLRGRPLKSAKHGAPEVHVAVTLEKLDEAIVSASATVDEFKAELKKRDAQADADAQFDAIDVADPDEDGDDD
ncbi:hypothetical protein [Microbacterium sp. SMR1]|uniref:hypothetical protein n=1 Tax=Microbacterium sp. SMR1 TaxID=1497340 RepID=UPI000DCB9211|nr:hypothetical protein [Microbacterium sp. SMR1]RAZ34816.1 hypothetical protein DO944_03060 [Microbacterium sp. SMR1]